MSDHGDGEKKKKSHGGGHGGGGYHPPHEEHEGAPEWLISFADFVMLCMGFFVILFALNVQPKGGNPGGGGEKNEGVSQQTPDMVDFAIAVREAFNNPVDPNTTDPNDKALVQRLKAREAGNGDAKDDGARGKDQNVTSVRPSDYHGIGASVPFAQRATMLDEKAARIVTEFAAKNRGMNTRIEVRGHASQSEAFRKPEEAMILSADRAMAVARALAAAGIDWWRLRLSSCGDHEREVANPNEETDTKNARVEILVTSEVADTPTPVHPPTPSDGDTPGSRPKAHQ
jgi:outer membrane protein OmpA-like peptidoglycan-associated protein